MELLIVTGMSGAGKSAVVDALEDLGYFCTDNMPPSLIPVIAKFISQSGEKKKIATVTDIRVGKKALADFKDTFETLAAQKIKYSVLFIDAKDDVLVNRYKETRRRHPLIDEFDGSLNAAIAEEREIIKSIRAISDYIIDTSKTSVQECKHRVNELFLDDPDSNMKIRCMSFGFKHGIPNDADIVLDVRCLPNPFYVPSLKYKTGLDKEVRDYVMDFDEAKITLEKMKDMIDYMVPLFVEEGKSQLVIAFGCTGGRHRSVTFAEKIKDSLRDQGYKVNIKHRDIDK